ncbi:MAG: sterol desaturase family protein [Polyangiaceae bacterium]|nr:sterol desaturase family protein [Polyangiaceae bacterium]
MFAAPQACTAFVAVVLMTLRLEWMHFLIHTRYKPQSAQYKRIWRNHRLHHCKNEHYWLGVSTWMGDVILRTGGDPKDVPASDTCKTLGFDPSELSRRD